MTGLRIQTPSPVIPTKVGTQKKWHTAQLLNTEGVGLDPDFRRDDRLKSACPSGLKALGRNDGVYHLLSLPDLFRQPILLGANPKL